MTLTTAGYDFTKPSSVTLDLGKKFKLSRMIVYGRRNGTDYSSIFDGLYPKEIEIWGRNDNNVTKFDPEMMKDGCGYIKEYCPEPTVLLFRRPLFR